jgi:cytochrome b6-f complex iron-sulfur subunit
MERRTFLSRAWKWGAGLIAAAGAWTSWDLLQPRLAAGFGGIVRTVPADSVPEDGVIEVPAARAYLTRIDGEIVALSETCTHLGCRVPWCASSGRFECPCHGSVFNRAGDYLAGPAPRGMDRYPFTTVNGVIEIDTADAEPGEPPGTLTIDEPARGPACAEGDHG